MTRRRRPRHAALIGTGRTRNAKSPTKPGDVRPSSGVFERPAPNYASAAGLAGVPKSQDGHTVLMPAVMRSVTLSSPAGAPPACMDTPAMAGAMADTMTLTAAVDAIPPEKWYGRDFDGTDWPDAPADEPPAPSLIGSGVRLAEIPAGCTCAAIQELMSSPAEPPLVNSALRHRTEVTADWFRDGRYLPSLSSFFFEQDDPDERAKARDRRIAAMNRNFKVTPVHARRSGPALDTGFVPAVVVAEFDGAVSR